MGQNLSYGSYKLGWVTAIKLWSDEVKDFRYGGSNVLSSVGHYTQVFQLFVSEFVEIQWQ